MYATILVPLDGSKRAEQILPHAEELAQRYKARIILLRVVEPPPMITDATAPYAAQYGQDIEELRKRAETYLSGLAGEFQEKNIQTRIRLGSGQVVDAILNAAQRDEADLIALASHGRTGLSRVFYGSVAAGVLHRVDRPLLLIRSS
ncbi:MAG: universal stress protein [Desulfohalobiaceae bacterium]|nr:universal stress protein [Desulfohalobiaceae bacterium]